jgi:hypothetical protein
MMPAKHCNKRSQVMAKCSAHGAEVGTLHFLTYSKRWMSDGVILKHGGFGWKLHTRCKPGVNVGAHFREAEAHMAASRARHPARTAYINLLHSMAGMTMRWKLHAAVNLMPDDCDGVWSECCDGYGDNIHADVDEVGELCRAYVAALGEAREAKSPVSREV